MMTIPGETQDAMQVISRFPGDDDIAPKCTEQSNSNFFNYAISVRESPRCSALSVIYRFPSTITRRTALI
jgi:hypothetical protein